MVDDTFLLWAKPQKLMIKRKISKRSFFIWDCVGVLIGLVKILFINGLRVGCCPVLRLRQGNIAYTLLCAAFLFIVSLV